jgi:phosphoserine aminotransferase
MLRWITEAGGVPEMAARSRTKAAAMYDVIDGSEFYQGLVDPASRSLVNVTFAAPSVELEQRFLADAASRGLDGLWGYRKVGHLRASLFNAVTVADCHRLVDFMTGFASRNRDTAPSAAPPR